MTATDRFLEDVVHRIAPGMPGVARLESDLRTHLRERVEAGEEESAAVARMGDPAEVVTGFLESTSPPLATPGQRAGGFLFDVGLGASAIAAVGALAAWILAPDVAVDGSGSPLPLGASGRPAWLAGRAAAAAPGIPPAVAVGLAASAILLFLAAILYFPVFETLFGQTAGKRLFGSVVARDTGERAGFGAAVLRRIPFLFDIWPFDAAFLLFTARRQRAFDLVAKTIVIRAEGRHPRRPWLFVGLVWLIAAGLALLAAWAGGAFAA
jgi:uncharacterized RDD family membrane protein YckC